MAAAAAARLFILGYFTGEVLCTTAENTTRMRGRQGERREERGREGDGVCVCVCVSERES